MSNPIYRLINKSDNKIVQFRNPEELAYEIHGKNFDNLIIIKSYVGSNKDIIVDLFGHDDSVIHIERLLRNA